MVQHGQLVIADLGENFTGSINKRAGRAYCVASPKVQVNGMARRALHELARREGMDCDTCRGCFFGTAN
ncbi:hypothetical protein [Streptomyces sp. NRRL S-1813]|uniref:hypothetical protein n=1 Tax=Streptomyces sp. NRRL S-1813 TaxID=1463888 RepID=UPI0004C5D53C|nr:hypothetical protein [Streptomyces sp. NRRL S-1813]